MIITHAYAIPHEKKQKKRKEEKKRRKKKKKGAVQWRDTINGQK